MVRMEAESENQHLKLNEVVVWACNPVLSYTGKEDGESN